MKVRYVMCSAPQAVNLGASVEEASKMMAAFGLTTVPVLFEGRPIGVVTDHTLTTRVVARGKNPHYTRVHEIMDPHPTCVKENAEVEMARLVLERAHVHQAIVCDDSGMLSGVVSLFDLERAAYEEAYGIETPDGQQPGDGREPEDLKPKPRLI